MDDHDHDDHHPFNPGKDFVIAVIQIPERVLRKERALTSLHFGMFGVLGPYIADPDKIHSEVIFMGSSPDEVVPCMVYYLPGEGPGALQLFPLGDITPSPTGTGEDESEGTPKGTEKKKDQPDPFRIKE